MQKPYTFILFGLSGSGKGTQARLLLDYLQKVDTENPTMYVETGQKIREFVTEASVTASITREIVEGGGLLPEFLPIWIWSEYFVRHVSGNEHMILDGLSRQPHEAPILDSAMRFYKRPNPVVIYIKVSKEWSKERLLSRKRPDDTDLDIEKRLTWFEEKVMPAIAYFRGNPYYTFVEINGEQPIELVFADILRQTGLYDLYKN